MIPKVSNALNGWMKTYYIDVVTKSVVGHIPTETTVKQRLKMCIQPMPSEKVNRKPEEQRAWIWYTIWFKSDNDLKIDDEITIDDVTYKIQSKIRWNDAGYYSCEAIEYFSN